MAKRNSTKTATKEALQASEPRIISIGQWNGINIKEAPLGFTPLTDKHGDTDLPDNFLMLQNNVITTSIKALQTRLDTLPVCKIPPVAKEWSGDNRTWTFTGIVYLYEDRLFAAVKTDELNNNGQRSDEQLWYYELHDKEHEYTEADWHRVPVNDKDRTSNRHLEITCISSYGTELIILTRYQEEVLQDGQGKGEIFTGSLSKLNEGVSCQVYVPNPTVIPTLTPRGDLAVDTEPVPICRCAVVYCYTNKFGSTLPSAMASINLTHNPVEWHAGRYLVISGPVPQGLGITGVDMYCALDENQDFIFIGHVELTSNMSTFSYNWMGAMNDTTQWTSVSLTVPTSNDTKGVDANYVRVHDGKLYFYGGSIPNRLYLGGDAGAELSVARGTGGAFVDLDPGTGLVINSTHKFKTYNGASIVTIMCGNKNTNAVKRFNLLETNLTITNELQSKGYEAEEVANVIGCNSHWGAGVFADGLYALSRYGLGVTTNQMEESNTLKVNYVSDAIQPIFTDRISKLLSNARMIYCDEVIYFALSVPGSENDTEEHEGKHTGLDRIIFAYDLNLRAWYTFSYEDTNEEEILHLFNFDYESWWEGIGLVLPDKIDRIPLTGPQSDKPPAFTALIETGELGLRLPPQIYVYLAQLEFRFDYLVGDLEIEVFGHDYYGREYRVYHKVTTKDKDGNYRVLPSLPVWVRVDKNVETYRVRIKGKAHFRLTHIMSKTYQQSDRIKLVYGYDSHVCYADKYNSEVDDHHYLESYNNFRKAIVV